MFEPAELEQRNASSSSIKGPAGVRKPAKRRRRPASKSVMMVRAEHEEHAKLAARFRRRQRLNKAAATPAAAADCHPPFLRRLDDEEKGEERKKGVFYQLRNAPKHDRLLARFRADDGARGFRWPERRPNDGRLVESTESNTGWLCALCQLTSCVGRLADLFGPYYCRLVVGNNQSALWPPYLTLTRVKSDNLYTDLWFHGECLLWTPRLFLCGTRLEGLEHLAVYWKSVCAYCHGNGASIRCAVHNCNKVYHYHCAEKFGCDLEDGELISRCGDHSAMK